jgi:hypothetical protein
MKVRYNSQSKGRTEMEVSENRFLEGKFNPITTM